MKIISFAWTTPALLAGRKTVTRRAWSHGYAMRFREGQLVQAYDRNPRHGGHKVATIRLTRDPYLESTQRIPPEDYDAEGFGFLEGIGAKVDGLTPRAVWRGWFLFPETLFVVRFEVVDVISQCDEGHLWREIRPKGHPVCVRCGTWQPGWVAAEPQLAMEMPS